MFEFIKKLFRRKENNMDDKLEMKELDIIIKNYLYSDNYKNMLSGKQYYEGKHDILKRVRQAIGEKGVLTPINNVPNNRIVDNQYAKLVNQKTNYLLSKVLTIQSENDKYTKAY